MILSQRKGTSLVGSCYTTSMGSAIDRATSNRTTADSSIGHTAGDTSKTTVVAFQCSILHQAVADSSAMNHTGYATTIVVGACNTYHTILHSTTVYRTIVIPNNASHEIIACNVTKTENDILHHTACHVAKQAYTILSTLDIQTADSMTIAIIDTGKARSTISTYRCPAIAATNTR